MMIARRRRSRTVGRGWQLSAIYRLMCVALATPSFMALVTG